MILYFEDLAVGQTYATTSVSVSAEEIMAFGRQFDPQPFHTDVEAARNGPFGELVASGWHTASLTMRLIIGGELKFAGGAVGRGVDNIEWPRPVKAGDALRAENEVIETRALKSRTTHGVIKLRTTTRNQHDEIVQTMVATILVQRRPIVAAT